MTDIVQTIADRKVLVLDPDAAMLDPAALSNDLVSLAWEHDAELIAIPAKRLPSDFFALRTGVLGDVAQKLTNYRVQMAVHGDVGVHVSASNAFGDFVRETNQGSTLWFVADLDALDQKLRTKAK